jgi:hypothetical protein
MQAMEPRSGVRMELKYCERCGGLWLRPAGSGSSYCESCAAAMAELPAVRLKRPAGGGPEEGRQP